MALLTGCSAPGGGSAPKGHPAGLARPHLVVPAAGQCVAREVADGTDVAPDFTAVVPCTKPHVYEVIGVRPVPGRFLDRTSAAAALARRTQLANATGSPRSRALQATMWPGCDKALRVATGLDRFTFGRKDANTLRVNPVLRNASPWLNLAPAQLWAKHPVAVCSVRYAGPQPHGAPRPPVRPVISATTRTVISTWMTPAFPLPFRLCATARGGRQLPCATRHGAEYLVTADFKAAYGPRFLAGVLDLANLPQQPYDQVMGVCRRLYAQTGNRVPRGLELTFRFSPKDNPDARRLVMSCVLQTRSGHDNVRGFRSLG